MVYDIVLSTLHINTIEEPYKNIGGVHGETLPS